MNNIRLDVVHASTLPTVCRTAAAAVSGHATHGPLSRLGSNTVYATGDAPDVLYATTARSLYRTASGGE
jgi:hypothetical protein